MSQIPRDISLDSSFALLSDGGTFIPSHVSAPQQEWPTSAPYANGKINDKAISSPAYVGNFHPRVPQTFVFGTRAC